MSVSPRESAQSPARLRAHHLVSGVKWTVTSKTSAAHPSVPRAERILWAGERRSMGLIQSKTSFRILTVPAKPLRLETGLKSGSRGHFVVSPSNRQPKEDGRQVGGDLATSKCCPG